MEKKLVLSESRIAFCQLFIVQVKKVCYERKVQGELLGCFFHCTLKCLPPHVPTTSFPLMVLWSKVVSVLQWNKHPNSKTQQKITYLLLYCVKSDWFYSIQIWSLKKHFICENCSKDTLNCSKLCGIAMQLQENILASLSRIFFAVELSLEFLWDLF